MTGIMAVQKLTMVTGGQLYASHISIGNNVKIAAKSGVFIILMMERL